MTKSELIEHVIETNERLARLEARREADHDILEDIKREVSQLQWRVAAISASVAGTVGGGMSVFG